MTTPAWSRTASAAPSRQAAPLDLISLGRRVRHLRKGKGLTLDRLGEAVGTVASQLSLIENGKREPKLSLLKSLAVALDVTIDDLLGSAPPSRRAALEIELERAQRGPLYASLGLPTVRISSRLPLEVLEALVGLQGELERRMDEQVATPEEARRANVELRAVMRERNNYFPEIETQAHAVLDAVGYAGGPVSQHLIADIAAHLGFSLHHVGDLPHSTRSVTDLKNRRIYLTQSQRTDHDPRSVLLQALGHYVLEHRTPENYGEFLRQRVATNYFAAALLLPEKPTVEYLKRAKAAKEIAVEDIRDTFAVSYETAAHRFTNLATEHLDIRTHFQKTHKSGIIYKAYENDGVTFPQDHTGAIEGQPSCRRWTSRVVFDVQDKFRAYNQYTDTPSGTYWCTARTERAASGEFSLSIGVPYAQVKWFRGRDTDIRETSFCPDESCCRRPPADLAREWSGQAWPSARAHSHLLAAMPPGAFPGVDETEVYAFLAAHSG
ncbi:helix-turn-helix domain-containing protein [Arthrobacter agilis]|uniref:helix-turn-helix domain-containing protein n=1 Tax=Arthrobacter agilis TaxID=37921 RepID=UPI000B34F7DE|nr:helix-turn-helix domain-containing protein [Arthrobacter agilis]OUM43676.1 XRE family transcriptional regulator [Arthrobacter agilis]PPB46737.1 helix-turn-helix domain-containing protein [Arthrobacter agilis]TPV24921.1 helix-turn-helix domain-containing protein [Arthrobacter agilis]VDR31089.1 anaerobic benzoate catabolism transcriptional regulator [Arthrobacter agilis]